ncbi:tyrosine-type recombinase/integrase [Neisseriaceae bacterium B1]
MALNDRLIKALKPKEKAYKQTDGGGLYLFIRPNGTKTWRMKYTLDGKEQLATFGTYPAVSLAEARVMRDELKAKIAKGVHTPKRAAKTQEQQVRPHTFEQAARKWFSVKQTQIAAKTQSNIKNRLENHLYPHLGAMELKAIKRADLIALTDGLNERGIFAEAQKVLQTASQVFEFAILNEWIENNPAHGLHALLKRAETVHREALPQCEIEPFFMAYLQGKGEKVTRIALLLVILTGARNQALRLSEWRNIDFEKKHGLCLAIP